MDSYQYFGVPITNIQQAKIHQGNKHQNIKVPTRKEVATLPPKELCKVLQDWMCRSATEIIPSRGQIYLVLEILRHRPDIQHIQDSAQMCVNYIID
ncbi:hypothetical protein [Herbaspirillum sp.]|uniref:hypothetical protein n=1 Tax=Herbaspirillum sp. TaxID=1890675 RepID=UPI001B29B9EE|nr:hypothetical protein [Herbaspirillum sp.]MBO9538289.1 hypothetical protein [Herbaspirillum sp.]